MFRIKIKESKTIPVKDAEIGDVIRVKRNDGKIFFSTIKKIIDSQFIVHPDPDDIEDTQDGYFDKNDFYRGKISSHGNTYEFEYSIIRK